jgi:hypothetical protein
VTRSNFLQGSLRHPLGLVALALPSALSLALGGQAVGAPTRDPRPVEARKACAAGNVDKGIEILAEIIVENGDPNAVYNQARCYQQNGRSEQAVPRFREYLRVAKGITPAERSEVEGYIRELETEVEARAVRRAAAPTVDPFAAAAAPASSASELAAAAPAPSAEGALRPLRIAAYVAAGTGVAALGAGAVFGWRTRDTARSIEQTPAATSPRTIDRLMDQGRQAETLQWVGYGVGAAALAGSAALFYLSRPLEPREAPQVVLVPHVSAGGGGAHLAVGF